MMKLKTYIPFALILLLPALLPEAAALRAQTSRNSFLKVSVGDIRYVDKAQNKKQTVGSILTDLATTAVTGKSTTQHDEYAPSVREAIVKALSDVTRFRVITETSTSTNWQVTKKPFMWTVQSTVLLALRKSPPPLLKTNRPNKLIKCLSTSPSI